MRLLVAGSAGLLGSAVVSRAQSRSIKVIGTYHSEEPDFNVSLERLDIQRKKRFHELIKNYEIDAVINCAAMTDVDACEANPELAYAVNATAPSQLAQACEEAEVTFVHTSTDYVFNGEASEPYDEYASPNPVQEYGSSKLAGERAVHDANDDALTVRLSFVYGVRGDTGELMGFPTWVRDRVDDGEEVPLFVDQRMTPTRAGQAADTLLDLLATNARGLYHVASRDCVTPYEFGEIIVQYQGSDAVLLKSMRDDIDRRAERPQYTCLDVSRVEEQLDRPQPTLVEDLAEIATYLQS